MYLFSLFLREIQKLNGFANKARKTNHLCCLSHKACVTNTGRACPALLSQSHLGEDFYGSS